MKPQFRLWLPIFLLFTLYFSACVSKKKHQESLKMIETIKANNLSETEQWKKQLNTSRDTIYAIRLRLAERKGENNALVAMQDKLQNKIDGLEAEIESLSNQSQSSSQSQQSVIHQKEKEISRLKEVLKSTEGILDRNALTLDGIANDLRYALQAYESLDFEIEVQETGISLALPEAFLFRKKSVTRLEDSGFEVLERISEVLLRYPEMNILVIGHTDNSPPANKSYKDNWNFSTLEAATIVRTLTEEYSINPSQITAAGQGEFTPRGSNETLEGRLRNRRISLFLSPRPETLPRAIRGSLRSQ